MRPRAGLRFLATVTLLIVARGLDALTTWLATHDLALETNPLTRLLHVGWSGLLIMNAVVITFISICAWRTIASPPSLPTESDLDLEEFIGRYWFAAPVRRSLSQAVFWLAADRRVRRAFIGTAGASVVIIGSFAAASWNMLVARGIVTGRVAGWVGFSGFWIGLTLGVALSVRVFLTRSYAQYSRAHARGESSAVGAT